MLKSIYNYIFNKSATLLNRHQLGSLSLDDARDELSENEQKERNANVSSAFRHIELSIKKLIIVQQEFMANQCENESQLLFGRGTTNGLSLVLEEMQSYKLQYEEDNKPKDDDFNKHKVF